MVIIFIGISKFVFYSCIAVSNFIVLLTHVCNRKMFLLFVCICVCIVLLNIRRWAVLHCKCD